MEAATELKVFSFSEALVGIKEGKKATRFGWNGRGMYVYLVNGSKFTVNRPPLSEILPEGTEVTYRAHIDMRTANGEFVPWIASQSDLIEEDWYFV